MLFSICKTRTRSCQVFLTYQFVYKDVTVRSLHYINRRKVLYVYVDITVLIRQKFNKALQQHLVI